MVKRQKKLVAVLAAAVTAVVALALFQARDPLREKYYLWKYERQGEGAGKVELLGRLMQVHSTRGFVLLVRRLNEHLDHLSMPVMSHPDDEPAGLQAYVDLFLRSDPDDMAHVSMSLRDGADAPVIRKFFKRLTEFYGREFSMDRLSLVSLYREAQRNRLVHAPAVFIPDE
jgi:hypothetical protein